MFCSHCGKTVDPAAEKCPHCGVALGESRLSGHTAVQPRIVPADQEGGQRARYTPYTKTTYTGEMNPGEDVYSRTAYRPVLAVDNQPQDKADRDDEAGQPDQGDQAASDDQVDVDALFKNKPANLDEAQKAALKQLEQVPEDAPPPEVAQKIVRAETGIQVKPLTPIKKKGISPEVESYIQRMEAMKGKKSAKKKERDEEYDEAEAAQVPDDGVERVPMNKPKGGARHLIGRIVAIFMIVCVIGGGIFYLAYVTQPKSQIEGVTQELFEEGLKVIKTRLTDDYRKEVVAIFQSQTMATDLPARQAADRKEIEDLMPERPQQHDQEFIDTLLAIQDAVDTATTTDGLAVMTKADQSIDLTGDSQKQWGIIDNYVKRLEEATNVSQLAIVSGGVQDVMATPTPSPTPAAESYQSLAKGAKGQSVRNLQERLRALGWLQGNVDGKYGTVTQTAIKYVQQALGRDINGIADGELQMILFSDDAPVKGEDGTVQAPTPAPQETPEAQK